MSSILNGFTDPSDGLPKEKSNLNRMYQGMNQYYHPQTDLSMSMGNYFYPAYNAYNPQYGVKAGTSGSGYTGGSSYDTIGYGGNNGGGYANYDYTQNNYNHGGGGGGGGGYGVGGGMQNHYANVEQPRHAHKSKPNNSAMSALTLLAFLFFLNILQSCLKEHMTAMNPTVMVMTAGAGRQGDMQRNSADEPLEPKAISDYQIYSSNPFNDNNDDDDISSDKTSKNYRTNDYSPNNTILVSKVHKIEMF